MPDGAKVPMVVKFLVMAVRACASVDLIPAPKLSLYNAPLANTSVGTIVTVLPEVVNELAFGFIQSRAGTLWDGESWGGYEFPGANHFQGQLDDVRIYHKALTAAEIDLMYKSEKP